MATQEPELAVVFKDLKSSIDIPTFEQILEMDDDADRDFSKALVFEFLTQAEETFERLEENLTKKDLTALSSDGHYLKGSSATLGLIRMRDHCEKIQRYGLKENVDGSPETDEALCLKRVRETLEELEADFGDTARALKKFYGAEDDDESSSEEEDEEEEEEEEEEAPAEEAKGAAKDAKDTKDTKDTKETTKEVTADKEVAKDSGNNASKIPATT